VRPGDLVVILIIAGFALWLTVWRDSYEVVYGFSPVLVAFGKFAILATLGETLVLRIRTGRYLQPGFGLVPKAVIWGLLGMLIYAAFVIFENGATALFFGGVVPQGAGLRLVRALSISASMNLIFAPVLMTTHHLTDLHIARNNGRFRLRTLRPAELFAVADWDRMWSFVFARTIPLFWIPAHTVTFLLPASIRLPFAALLSIVLGLFLALVRPKSGAG
jgi:hypothetical protein